MSKYHMAVSPRRDRSGPKRATTTTCAAIQRDAQAGAPKWIIVTAFIVLVLLALALVYQSCVRYLIRPPAEAARRPETFASAASAFSGDRVLYLYIDGCMWCDKFSPEWTKFVQQQGAALSAANVAYAKIDGHSDDSRIKDIDVKGYPAIVFIAASKSNSTFSSFEGGSRTAATVTKFVKDKVPAFVPALAS